MNSKRNYKLILISIAIISILLVTAVYAISEAHKTVIIDPQSDYGRELTAIAEKAIEEEGIDTKYLHPGNLVQESPDTITLTFSGAKRFSNGIIYSYANLDEEETITFFAADLDRYGVYTYYVQPENGRIYDKNVVSMPETFGQGKDYNYNIQDSSIELIDPATNKVMFVLSDYKINQDKNKADTIADEINSKYANAQQPLPIDKEKPYIIIDVTGEENEGYFAVEIAFYKGELYSMYIEERTKEENVNGFYKTSFIHSVKHYNEEGETAEDNLYPLHTKSLIEQHFGMMPSFKQPAT